MKGTSGSQQKKKWEGPVYLTADDLSQMFQVSLVLVYKWVRTKKIPFYHLGGCVRFSPEQIQQWLEERKNQEVRKPRKLRKSERLPDA